MLLVLEAFVSSYIAAKSRLENRKEKLQDYIDNYSKKSIETITEITFVDDFDTEDENTETINLKADFDPTVVVENAKQELIEVKNLQSSVMKLTNWMLIFLIRKW